MTVDVEVVFARIFYHKVTLFSHPSHTVLFGRRSPCAAHTVRVVCYAPPLSGWSSCINYVAFFVSSLPFINLCNHLLIFMWTHGYLFVLWIVIQYYFILLLTLFQLWRTFSWLLWYAPMWLVFNSSLLLALLDAPGLSYSAWVLKSAISLRSPSSLY